MAYANHDFRCPECGAVRLDVPILMSVGASHASVCCPNCTTGDEVAWMDPIPAMRLSLFSDGDHKAGSSDFTKHTTQVEDPSSPTGYREVTVGSLADIRRLERESERAERNGEGRRMVFRDYSQDRSNVDVHTLGQDPSLKPAKTFTNGTPVVSRRGDSVVADHGTVED